MICRQGIGRAGHTRLIARVRVAAIPSDTPAVVRTRAGCAA